METDYQYDLLNNLIKVTQNGNGTTDSPRVRTFTYDSLSQLLCANNPENSNPAAPCPTSTAYNGYVAGTTGYWYDLNGNVAAKEDARGVTTSYSYDQMNRLLKKSYSDGFTPTSCYLYDSAINGIHRLGSEWTQKASNPSCSSPFAPQGGYFSARWIRAYDAMGRIQAEQQYTPNSIANGKFYPMSYTYDLAGNVTSSTAGAVPPGMTTSQASAPCASAPVLNTQMFTFLSCYDAAGRLQGVTSNASSSPSALLFTAQWYPPFTGLPNAVYGNNAVTLTRGYDPRLRITSEQDSGNSPLSATNGSALLTITGDEQSY
jgi:YD repeat-containing protein